MTKRGGARPGAGRPKVPTEQDPDRFFVVIWRVLVGLLGYDPIKVGYLAAHLVSAEPTGITDIEGVLRMASTEIKHHASDLKTHIVAMVEKAKRSSESDPWFEQSEIAILSFFLARLMSVQPALSDKTRAALPNTVEILRAQLRDLGWGELLPRLETRLAAALGSNFPPHDAPLSRRAAQLLKALKGTPQKN
jgi:hypothetical protein